MRRVPWAGLCVVAFCFFQGLYAVWLNTGYYQHYGPFFDSMSYWRQYARVLAAVQDGFPDGFQAALSESTVSLPWMVTVLFGKLLPYTRAVGIWIQECWTAALALSVLA